ncbi:phosphoribosylformylglycinamidine cyclo-ligase [Auraticoccus sp. F435]|uniref:Phosphoribosylformylglycinamidine cyclo-ligase n=1 Tax=Auraticoccus cholistanensis TaxID=2656650 RepID=A0A6A9UUI8_9ACTN|nr:phosphoribosylformylglycinamidine cyclo-ligase [Auraticoccus cholistanensis]
MDAPNTSAYARAGVDIEAGERAVDLLKTSVGRTRRPEVIGGLGGFAGLFDASTLARYQHPVLATSTDGVGTKVAIAQAMDVHTTIGHDLVGMLVDDLVVCGAEPLFVTDYIACGRLVPERIADIVSGIADACVLAGASLLGGETAEHPGLLEPDAYDVAGATTGIVERDKMLGAERVRPGDVLVAMAASGLHSNGYSLVRHVVAEAGWALDREVPEFGRTLGEELLEPTRIYALDCLALTEACEVRVLSHVTGGGLANNLSRVLPESLSAVVERSSWTPPAVFSVLQELGRLTAADVEATWNMGVGMVAVLPPESVDTAVSLLASRGLPAWVCGRVEDVPGGRVELVGDHR